MSAAAVIYAKRTTAVEIDAGTSDVTSVTGTISDSRVSSSTLVTAHLDYTAATDKDLDEIEAETPLQILVGTPVLGSFSYILRSLDGSGFSGKFRIKYSLN